jgi:hypothetical protein
MIFGLNRLMVEIREVLRYWGRVFGNWKYTFGAVIVAVLFYVLNVLIAQYSALINFYSSFGILGTGKFFLTLIWGFGNTIYLHSYVSLIVISILFGILASLLFYKTQVVKGTGNKKIGFFASAGIFFGVLAPGCAACGLGLASILGLGAGFLSFLPYDGLELSLLSVVILLFVTFKISNDSCKIMFKKKMKGGYNE